MDAPFTGSVFLGMSVDGFIARPDGDLAWLTGGDDAGGAPDDGEGGDFGFAEFVSGIDALVMGRGTYEVIAPLDEWPYQGRPVHVVSTTLEPGADARITVHRSFDDAVAALTSAGYRRGDRGRRPLVATLPPPGLGGGATPAPRAVGVRGGGTPLGPRAAA